MPRFLIALLVLSGCARPQLARVQLETDRDFATFNRHHDTPALKIGFERFDTAGLRARARDEERLHYDVARYVASSLPDEVYIEPGAAVDAELDLKLQATLRTRRTLVLDIFFAYPGLGLLPIPHPEWGGVEVHVTGTLRHRDGRSVALSGHAERPYSEVMYAWYRTGPAEEAMAAATTKALSQIVQQMGDRLVEWRLPPKVAPGPTMEIVEAPLPEQPATVAPAARGEPRRVAILEVHDRAELSPQEATYLTDLLRDAALRLPRDQYFVMTRENILELLPPGKDLAACEGKCEIETGRNIGAHYVVSGRIIRFGESLRVTMALHEVESARLLATGRAAAENVEALEAGVVRAADELFRELEPPPDVD